MKYWLLTTEYPPAHGGGISTYCRCTAEMLTTNGIDTTVIVSDDHVQDYVIESPAAHLLVVRFNPARRPVPAELAGTTGLSYAFYTMVDQLIKELGPPGIIESQDYLGIAYYLQQFKLLGYLPFSTIPVVVTIHAPAFVYLPYNDVPIYRFPDFWTGVIEKESIRAADLVISPSRFMAEEVAKDLDFQQRPPVILPYAYRSCAPAKPKSIQRNKIVYYGKLSPQKGTFELLKYFSALWDQGFTHPLHIIGGTDIVYQPAQQTMGQIVRQRYAGYIRRGLLQLHGKIDPGEIPAALADAHVVLLPSIVDNLPFACLETLACGKVVLASIQGGQREIIRDGETGFLFDHREPDSFGQKLKHILSLSDEQLTRIGQNAVAGLSRYDYEVIAPLKLDLLEKLATTYRPPMLFPFVHRQQTSPAWQEPAPAGRPLQADNLPPRHDDGADNRPPIDDLLSVVIPFYNLGAYLDDAVRSVLASTWRSMEIIIIDDGSTENSSLSALDRWRTHPGITVIHQRNAGLSAARNSGARQAKGRFLAFLDADDAVMPDYYEKAIRVLHRYSNIHFVGCWVSYFGNATGLWPAFNPAPPYLLAHNPVNSSGLVYKTGSFLAAGLNDPKLKFGLEDYESVVGMSEHGFDGVVLPEPLHRYRVRPDSMIRSLDRTKLMLAHTYISEKHKTYYSRYAAELTSLLNCNGPGYYYENPTFGAEKPNSWQSRIKKLARKNKNLKLFLLTIKKQTNRLWQRN